jgi:hypothetical protein
MPAAQARKRAGARALTATKGVWSSRGGAPPKVMLDLRLSGISRAQNKRVREKGFDVGHSTTGDGLAATKNSR